MALTSHVCTLDNRAVLIKRATSDESRARLAHESRVLTILDGLGVPELMEFREVAGVSELLVAYVGGPSLCQRQQGGQANPEIAAAVAVSLSTTLAAAHERGVVHGRVSADHVLGIFSATPILCGWAGAEVITDWSSDLEDLPNDPRDDVVALAKLVLDAVEGMSGELARSLRTVAHRVPVDAWVSGAPTPAAISMRALAQAFSDCVSAERGSRVGGSLGEHGSRQLGRVLYPKEPSASRSLRRSAWLDVTRMRLTKSDALKFACSMVAIAFFWIGLSQWRRADAPSSSAASDSTAQGAVESARCREKGPATSVEAKEDWCEKDLSVEGRIVRAASDAGNVVWKIGGDDDIILIGDWDGDGTPTAGVVRQSTGEVWAFDHWAVQGEQLRPRFIARQSVSVAAAKVIHGDGHDRRDAIEIIDTEGVAHLIEVSDAFDLQP